ncbi:MAG: TonB-dependent receptor [Culturomica sp.]|jgi:TonB-linked SusC/RagA family outer membrane protein|nr:TonB-dependent receptor [Culturomica sp.]
MKRIFLRFMLLLVGLYAGTLMAQQVKGTVKDSQGPLPGVSIQIVGTSVGTSTDVEGNFTINVSDPAKTVLKFVFIGMKPLEVSVNGRADLGVITMEEEATMLDEVVAIGYGTVRRKDVTGSVSSVSSEALTAIPVASAVEAMAGKMAGVQITTTEGSPDAEMRIRVRGGGSITGDNTPLFIVDGFPVESISDIAPSEIENIDVLKDASSTAIYGSRGANGVIIVTTKSGKSGKTTVSYNAYYGVKKMAKTLNVLSVPDYVKWQYELQMLDDDEDLTNYEKYFGSYQDIDMYDNVKGNNWQDQVFGRLGHTFNHSLSVNGGSEKIAYTFNYSYVDDKAIMEGSSYRRDNVSFKLNHKPNEKVAIDLSARYSDTKINGGGMNEQNEVSSADSRMKHSVIFTPIPLNGVSSEAGDEETYGDLLDPLQSIKDNEQTQRRTNYNLGAAFSWEVINNLRLKSEIGLDQRTSQKNRYYGMSTYYVGNNPPAEFQDMPALTMETTKRKSLRNTNTVSYDFKDLINSEEHHLNLLLGEEMIITKSSKLTNTMQGYPAGFTFNNTINLTTQAGRQLSDNYLDPNDKLLSFFGRLNYDFNSKYIASLTFRADGSSKFADGNRWGYFPSAAVAWRISSESFMESTQNWLDDLKLRASYGTAGNNNIASGQMTQSFQNSTSAWINGYDSNWAPSTRMANPDLKWETTHTRNIGLDFSLFRSRLNGSVEVYLNSTKDLLMDFPVQGTGYLTQYRNMGETENKGLEVSLNYVALDEAKYGLSFNFNIGFNKNKIKSLGMMEDFTQASGWASTAFEADYIVRKGGSVGEMYGIRSAGRYEVDDFEGYQGSNWVLKEGLPRNSYATYMRPGAMKLVDQPLEGSDTGDGLVNGNDRVVIGNANPIHTGGLTINGRLYGFDISAVLNWSYGNDIYNANKIEYTTAHNYRYRNMIDVMADGKRWTNLRADGTISNDPTELAAMNANTTMWSPASRYVFSDWAVEDGSFLRLNTLTLGYTLPTDLTQKLHIQRVRFYVTGYNVACLTGYSGFDPEVSTRRKTPLTPGVDYSAYPKSRQFVFGLNVNF